MVEKGNVLIHWFFKIDFLIKNYINIFNLKVFEIYIIYFSRVGISRSVCLTIAYIMTGKKFHNFFTNYFKIYIHTLEI
jgi:hypothetical protein